jgi:HK97 family phage major capsid protein
MGSKRTVLEKADLAVSDLTTEGGYLLPKQAAKFIKRLTNEAKLMPLCTVVPMPSPQFPIETIGFGERVLRRGAERTALSQAQRSRPTMTKVDMDAKLFKAEIRISYESLEDNLEQAAIQNTIMGLLTERVAFDMDELAVISDTAGADPDLNVIDGILVQATSHTPSNSSSTLDADFLNAVFKAMPKQWRRMKSSFKFLTSENAEQDYRHSLVDRETVVGEKFLLDDVPTTYRGIQVVPIPSFPEDLGGGSDETVVILTDPKNIYFGIWRKIRVETDKDITAGEIIIVVTLRYDVKYAIEDAVVKGIEVTAS